MVVHQNLNVTVQFMMVRVGSAGVFLLKSTIIFTLWSVFSYVIKYCSKKKKKKRTDYTDRHTAHFFVVIKKHRL